MLHLFKSLLATNRVLPLIACLTLILTSGCTDEGESDSGTGDSTGHTGSDGGDPPAPESDDAEAVAALEKAGFQLTRDGENVTACSVNSDSDISDSFVHLKGIPGVQTLTFSGPGIQDKGLDVLSELKHVRALHLSDSAIGDTTLETVGKMESVQVLSLRRTNVTDPGLAAISGLPGVR
ncbi:MAG TPA: hypothetical protein DCG12_06095, partial [Planctomycetaceae bacterium]|nr:hypothetical protein [Planctomycetaceae bacterium]